MRDFAQQGGGRWHWWDGPGHRVAVAVAVEWSGVSEALSSEDFRDCKIASLLGSTSWFSTVESVTTNPSEGGWLVRAGSGTEERGGAAWRIFCWQSHPSLVVFTPKHVKDDRKREERTDSPQLYLLEEAVATFPRI